MESQIGGGECMIHQGRKNVLGVMIDATDYECAISRIMAAAREGVSFAVSALAVHGTMTGAFSSEHRYRLNCFQLLVPDGQPVRWALNWLHSTNLNHRVYGPTLTRMLFEQCATEAVPVYLYGTDAKTLDQLTQRLRHTIPQLTIAGCEPSCFGTITNTDKDRIADRIRKSGAKITFVALGCPRQEIWAYEFRELLNMPVIAVGAAFPFIAGSLAQAPQWMQDRGLEWLFRLAVEPRRLWRRYLLLNPLYLSLVLLQRFGVTFSPCGSVPPSGPIPA